nr:hypothetical protein [uncultured Duganella sp.]
MLTEQLANAGVKLNSCRPLSAFLPEDNDPSLPLVFIVPVRGDMDLLDAHFVQLKTIAQHPRLPGPPLVFVLHGDRHVWDEVDDNCPIYAKLKAMFFYSGTFLICPEKLDPDSASVVARHVLNAISTPPCAQEMRVAAIARLLNKRPTWRAPTKHLGFYDGTTGQSLLNAVPAKTADAVLGLIQELELNSLELNHAALLPEQLDGHRYAARKIDFIGNRLNFATIWAVCPGVEWMNLAANGLSAVDAGLCPSTLQHWYLHKNAIHTLHVPAGLTCKFRSLSMYRNRLTELKLPADQTNLVKLNLGANPITDLPETLQNSRDLEFLGLARTGLRALPNWLFEMPKLKEVDLSHMQHLIPDRQIQRLATCGVNIILEPGKEQHAVRV